MMLSEGDGLYPGHPKLHDSIHLVNLDMGAILRVRIPLLQDHCILDSLDGLLVLQRDHDTTVVLLHPFTGDILELPPLSTLLPLMDEDLCNFSSKNSYRSSDQSVLLVALWMEPSPSCSHFLTCIV
ncbi:hypothetical protein PR202_gb11025 [Eleusine coracana subsp. coracana]|uniref:KIB1-4 beta-propeller domain-containing protein n=1 Tax=Eleusine coracana subsp. coracana TaxID=191504 RepID=A0AAV5ELH4_ELECO|nr:hypothetical protein PR202_gb11025 [Eleusine coracana subsp. coracana]